MKREQERDIIEYGEDKQKLFIQFMLESENLFVRSRNILNPSYWSEKFRAPVKYILEYADKHARLPSRDIIQAETSFKLEPMHDDISVEEHSDWYLDNIQQFCRHKAMEALVYDGPKLLEEGNYSELEKRSKENMLISLQKELGTDYFLDPLARLKKMKDRTGMTSTGWKDIDDKLYGGFNRGELSFFAGGPGTGKSLFLQNLALNWVQRGLNVIYITLELSEDLVGLRFDAMTTGIPTKQIFKEIESIALKLGALKRASGQTTGTKWGNLQIRKLPEAGTCVNDIRSYMKEFEIQTGLKPDALVVDYLDLLHPNNGKVDPSNLFTKDKYTSEELRALASEYNVLACTASQLNRASIQEQDFDPSHIAGGISKINTADNVMGIFTSASMKERGEYQIQFLKTRSSSGVGSKIYLKFSPESLRITDMPEGETSGYQSGVASIQDRLAAKTHSTQSMGTSYAAKESAAAVNAPQKDVTAMIRNLGSLAKDLRK